MNDLENLYRQVIMDNYKNPKNKGLIENDKYIKYHMSNPSCGDEITIQVLIDDNTVKDLKHDGKGCSICCASASIMSSLVKNKSVDVSTNLINNFSDMLLGKEVNEELLDEAIVFKGVSKFPARMKCASLAWKALEKVIEGDTNE